MLDCSTIPDLEFTALKMLTEFEEELSDHGITLWLVALNPEPLKVIRHAPLGDTLGDDRLNFNLEQAEEAYQAQYSGGS